MFVNTLILYYVMKSYAQKNQWNFFFKLILLHQKFLQFDWLRAGVVQLNLKYLHEKITNLLRVVA